MWDNYNEEVKYTEHTGKRDKFNNPVPSKEIYVKVRFIKGYDTYVPTDSGTITVYKRLYKSPIQMVVGGTINDKLVIKEVSPVMGHGSLNNKVHYWKVTVV